MPLKNYEAWPALPYEEFQSTQHLLHMLCQATGKLKLITPFEPHWANVALWLTSRGLTTGLVPYQSACFSVDLDLISQLVTCTTTAGDIKRFELKTTSVSNLVANLFAALQALGITLTINPKPQELENPIIFTQDSEVRAYNPELANAWWRILVSSYRVMQRYHAVFTGRTPMIGLMWGTFDLRDARYLAQKVPTTGPNADYIRRNAMDVVQVEAGFWSGNPAYTKPAYFSFVYPQPKGIEVEKIQPAAANWNAKLGEFVLDYDDVRKAKNPEKDLLAFFQSTYLIEAARAGFAADLISTGEPV